MVEHSSWFELSESALRNNIRTLKRIVGPAVRFCSVVKANAYGHGLAEFASLAQRCGVRCFGVFSAEEAHTLAQHITPDNEIMIMGALDRADVGWAVENGISFYAFDLDRLDAAEKAAASCGRAARVHLEVETGMYRLGLTRRALEAALRRIEKNPDRLELVGVCTHLAGAESSSNNQRIQEQIRTFQEIMQKLRNPGRSRFLGHLSASAAGLLFPAARGDMVRFGIAQYGFWPSLETKMTYLAARKGGKGAQLHRVLSWRSRLMETKTVPSRKFVGYGNAYLTTRKTRIAAVPVGYHHGIGRNQSNLGHVLVRGLRCAIVGIINMNMMTVDVTHVAGAKVGDEVVILGNQGTDEISVGEFGNRTNDLNYETLARLNASLKRVVVA